MQAAAPGPACCATGFGVKWRIHRFRICGDLAKIGLRGRQPRTAEGQAGEQQHRDTDAGPSRTRGFPVSRPRPSETVWPYQLAPDKLWWPSAEKLRRSGQAAELRPARQLFQRSCAAREFDMDVNVIAVSGGTVWHPTDLLGRSNTFNVQRHLTSHHTLRVLREEAIPDVASRHRGMSQNLDIQL
jgi:hypothetical protein